MEDIIENFIKSKTDVNELECWLWKGVLIIDGGSFAGKKYKTTSPRRLAYLHYKGEIEGGYVFNTCGSDKCVNPDHLTSNRSDRKKSLKYTSEKTFYKSTKPKIKQVIKIEATKFWELDSIGAINWSLCETDPVYNDARVILC